MRHFGLYVDKKTLEEISGMGGGNTLASDKVTPENAPRMPYIDQKNQLRLSKNRIYC